MADVLAFPTRERRFDAALSAYRLVGLMRDAVEQISEDLAGHEDEYEELMRQDFAQRWRAHCDAAPDIAAQYADQALLAELNEEIWTLVCEVLDRRLGEIDRSEP